MRPAVENLSARGWRCSAAGLVNFPGDGCLLSASRASKSVLFSSALYIKESSINNRYLGTFWKSVLMGRAGGCKASS